MNRKRLIGTFALTTLQSGGLARAQAPAGYELALVCLSVSALRKNK